MHKYTHTYVHTYTLIYCIVYKGTDDHLEYLYMSSDMATRLITPSPTVTVYPLLR